MKLVHILLLQNSLVFMEGDSVFLASEYLSCRVNGALLVNPSLNFDGSYKVFNFGSRWQVIKDVITESKRQMQQRYTVVLNYELFISYLYSCSIEWILSFSPLRDFKNQVACLDGEP